MWIHTAQRACV